MILSEIKEGEYYEVKYLGYIFIVKVITDYYNIYHSIKTLGPWINIKGSFPGLPINKFPSLEYFQYRFFWFHLSEFIRKI